MVSKQKFCPYLVMLNLKFSEMLTTLPINFWLTKLSQRGTLLRQNKDMKQVIAVQAVMSTHMVTEVHVLSPPKVYNFSAIIYAINIPPILLRYHCLNLHSIEMKNWTLSWGSYSSIQTTDTFVNVKCWRKMSSHTNTWGSCPGSCCHMRSLNRALWSLKRSKGAYPSKSMQEYSQPGGEWRKEAQGNITRERWRRMDRWMER